MYKDGKVNKGKNYIYGFSSYTKALKRGVSHDRLMNGAREYKSYIQRKKDSGGFVPCYRSVTTFLNNFEELESDDFTIKSKFDKTKKTTSSKGYLDSFLNEVKEEAV